MSSRESFVDAGIIVIGDEILKGHTQDTNASFLLSKLWSNGIQVKKVVFIPDELDIIAKETRKFSEKYSIVITSGGVGPTHDDMTYDAIAKAFGEKTYSNDDIKLCIETVTKRPLTKSLNKMANIPESSKLIFGIDPVTKKKLPFPLVSVRNVYIFPGVPGYLQKSFLINQHLFAGVCKFLLIKVYIATEEDVIAESIEEIGVKYPDVQVGSYPMLNEMYKVKVTLESQEEDQLKTAYEELIRLLPNDVIVSVRKCLPNQRDSHEEIFMANTNIIRPVSASPHHLNNLSVMDLEHLLDVNNTSPLSIAIKCACSVLNQSVLMYKLNEICIGFNGGKDCTAVLHLLISYLKKMFPEHSNKLVALYIKSSEPFKEAHDFMEDCATNYNLDLIIIEGSIKEGLAKLKHSHPQIKAVVMGTRRHDPYSSTLRSFAPTDKNWPEFMRVLPILDWSYCEVWEFLKEFDLPYCKLYDEGYTSLGSKKDTVRNPALKLADGRYSPAFSLKDGGKERHGRDNHA